MIGLTEEGKKAFIRHDDIRLYLKFQDGTVLSNDDIVSNSFSLEQSICEEEQIVYGAVNSACMSIQILRTLKSYKGMDVSVCITAQHDKYKIDLGTFTVTEDVLADNRRYRTLTCYDGLYYVLDFNVTEWYDSLEFPMTLKEFRYSLFDYVNIHQDKLTQQEEVTLKNDSLQLEKTIDTSKKALTFRDVVQAICELNGAMGHMTQWNNFRYITPDLYNDGLYPRDDLYPSEDLYPKVYFYSYGLYPNNNLYPSDELYPEDPKGYAIFPVRGESSTVKQSSYIYKDFTVQRVNKVTIKNKDEDEGVSASLEDGDNEYVILNNILLPVTKDNTDVVSAVASNILFILHGVSYIPVSVTMAGLPWIEIGDYVEIVGINAAATFPVLHRTMNGIINCTDSYEANGTEFVQEKTNSVSHSLKNSAAKQSELSLKIDTCVLKASVITDINASEESELIDIDKIDTSIITNSNETDNSKLEISDGKLKIYDDDYNYVSLGVSSRIKSLTTETANSDSTETDSLFALSNIARIADAGEYEDRQLYAYTTAEPYFGDIGEATVASTGSVTVSIEDIFNQTISHTVSYQVFLQPYGSGSVYVSSRDSNSFTVVGTPGLDFGWEIKAKQSGYEDVRLEEYQ